MNKRFRAGLVLLGVVSLADVSTPLLTDGEHPPMGIAVVAAVFGLVSLVLVARAWQGRRRAVVPLIVLRVLSAAAALPAFFATDVPAGAMVAAGLVVALTVLGIGLVLVTAQQPVSVR